MRHNQSQLNAYRGILKNKNLATIMESGLTAPLGSTKRKQAQKVLSILKKTAMDGQGGPALHVKRVNLQLKPRVIDYSNFLILPPTPPIRVQIGDNAPTPKPVYDGQGYPGPMGSPSPMAGSTLNLSSKVAPVGLNIPKYAPSVLSRVGSGLGVARGGLAALTTGPVGMGITAASVGVPKLARNPIFGLQDRLVDHPAIPGMGTANSTVPYQEVLPKGQTATGNRVGAATAAATASAAPVTFGMPGGLRRGGPGTATSGPMQGPKQFNPNEGRSISDLSIEMANNHGIFADGGPTSPPRFPGVQGAIDAGMGPTMFAYNTLAEGGEVLRQQMPWASTEMLEGGGLEERLKRIKESTRKSWGLDQMEGQLNSLIASGSTLGGSLTDYIRGRDEYLNETEGLINDLKQSSLKMDMSDPSTRSNMNQHFNYLYEMRGRQNKRYIEFLKMSTDEYSIKIQGATNFYNTTLAAYQTELASAEAITKEQYNVHFTSLTEAYEQVAGAEKRELEMKILVNQEKKSRLDLVGQTIELEGQNSGSYTNLKKTLQDMGSIGPNGEWIINQNAIRFSGPDAQKLPYVMEEAVRAGMFTYGKDNEKFPVDAARAKQVVANALGQLDKMEKMQLIDPSEAGYMRGRLRSTLENSFKGNTTFLDAAKVPLYRQAVESLAKPGWFGRVGRTPTRDEFIKAWGTKGAGLDMEILNSIYSNLDESIKGGTSGASYINEFFREAGALAQPGELIEQDSLLRRKILQDYSQSLRADDIIGEMIVNQGGGPAGQSQGQGNRPQRNNNPLNIKSSSFTQQYAGVSGVDPSPASDGGNFLIFNSPEAGFQGAMQLLSTPGYMNLTVDGAMKRWSNSGYGGEVLPGLGGTPMRNLTREQLFQLVQIMAHKEGYYD